jgi:hypothetical protein
MAKVSIVEVASEREFLLDLNGDVNPEKEVQRFLEVFPDGGKELNVILRDSKLVEDVEIGTYSGFHEFLEDFPEEKEILEKEEYVEILLYGIGCDASVIIEAAYGMISSLLGLFGSMRF